MKRRILRRCWLTALLGLAGCTAVPESSLRSESAQSMGHASVQATSLAVPEPEPSMRSCHPEPLQGPAALMGRFTDIAPRQALQARALNARVCWGGGLRSLTAVSEERDCMVVLQVEVGADSFLRWPREATFFKACGVGAYDRRLLEPFTLVWVSGKVTGQAEFASDPIPVIEIDAVYRGSDCLQGETSPQCVHGYIQPQKKQR